VMPPLIDDEDEEITDDEVTDVLAQIRAYAL
jgi:hypothetical protein